MFTPTHEASAHGARLGRIEFDGKSPVETPALLVHTICGSLPSVPPDLASEIPVRLAFIDLSEVLEHLKLDDPSSFLALPKDAITVLSPSSMLSSPVRNST